MNKNNSMYIEVAQLHINSMENGFLPTIGVGFLSLLYKCIDESDSAVLIVKYNNKKMVGFVSATNGTSSIYRMLYLHPIRLIIVLLMLVFSLKKLKKIIDIFFYTHGSRRSDYPNAELLTICVDNSYRRQGIADDLYRKLILHFKKLSIHNFTIIVGGDLGANSFYVKNGANLVGSIQIHSGPISNIYVHNVS